MPNQFPPSPSILDQIEQCIAVQYANHERHDYRVSFDTKPSIQLLILNSVFESEGSLVAICSLPLQWQLPEWPSVLLQCSQRKHVDREKFCIDFKDRIVSLGVNEAIDLTNLCAQIDRLRAEAERVLLQTIAPCLIAFENRLREQAAMPINGQAFPGPDDPVTKMRKGLGFSA